MAEYNFDASLKAVLAELDKIPAKIEVNIVRGAVRAAAKPMLEAARNNVPEKTGKLRDSIRLSANLDRRAGMVSVKIRAGGRTKKGDPYYAHMVEFGTASFYQGAGRTIGKPYIIRGKNADGSEAKSSTKRGALKIGGNLVSQVMHPGIRAAGFMRRAFDANGQAVVNAYAEYMRKRIPKELGKHGGG